MHDAQTHKVALALGSNVGDRMAALQAAVEALGSYIEITAKSPVYETAPVYVLDQPAFLNAALIGKTKLPPLDLLHAIKTLEHELGREKTFHNGPRSIDIDVIFYDQDIVNAPELVIPHPHMAEREFVLRPLNDVAADWRHPKSGQTVAEMLARLPERSPRFGGNL